MAPDIFSDLQQSDLCGGEIERTITTLRYEFDGFAVIVEGVPAVFCRQTQEELVDGPLAVALGDVVHKLAETARLIEEQSPNREDPVETIIRFGSGSGALVST